LEAHKNVLVEDLLKKGVQVQMFTASATKEPTRMELAQSNPEQNQSGRNPNQNPRDRNKREQQSNENT
jgi:hypothetical protein